MEKAKKELTIVGMEEKVNVPKRVRERERVGKKMNAKTERVTEI